VREKRFNYAEEFGRLIFTNRRRITLLPGKMGKMRGLPEKRKKNDNQYFILKTYILTYIRHLGLTGW
jgi:hypothetical protein